jgi:hypothetical protein
VLDHVRVFKTGPGEAIVLVGSGATIVNSRIDVSAAGPSGAIGIDIGPFSSAEPLPLVRNVVLRLEGGGSSASPVVGIRNEGTATVIEDVVIEMSGSLGLAALVGLSNEDASPSLARTRISVDASTGADATGVLNVGASTLRLNDVTISTVGLASAVGLHNQGTARALIDRSSLAGDESIVNDNGTSSRVGASKLVGQRIGSAMSFTCIGSYTESGTTYVALGSQCQ